MKSANRHTLIVTVALYAVLACLVWAGKASADPFTPELEADYQAALAWWGVETAPQCASVTREIVTAVDPWGEGVAGRTTRPMLGETGVACSITFYEPAFAEQFGAGCGREAALRHEVGHLLGYGHTDDPRDIMSAAGLNIYACPRPIEDLRMRRQILVVEYCVRREPGTVAARLCWAKSRRLLSRIEGMVADSS